MDFRGVFDQGVIRPLEPVNLPEGTEVECRPIDSNDARAVDDRFWQSRTLKELAAEQQVTSIDNLEDLRGDWPAEESLDDFLTELRKSRR